MSLRLEMLRGAEAVTNHASDLGARTGEVLPGTKDVVINVKDVHSNANRPGVSKYVSDVTYEVDLGKGQTVTIEKGIGVQLISYTTKPGDEQRGPKRWDPIRKRKINSLLRETNIALRAVKIERRRAARATR